MPVRPHGLSRFPGVGMLLGALGFSTDLAIDLGTANTCVFAPGRGIVLNEPSVVAYNTAHNRIEAVGTKAREMIGRTPRDLVAIRPMRDGVIADFEAAERMLTDFIRRANRRNGWMRPRVVVGVPAEITQVERRAVRESTLRAKASEVYLVDEPVAAAIGAGPAHHRAHRQHDRGHRRRHHRHRRRVAGRHGLPQVRARGRRRDGRRHPGLHEEGARPADRRTHRRVDQDRDRVGRAARRAACGWRSAAGTSPRDCPRASRSPTPRSARPSAPPSTSSSAPCATAWSGSRRSCRPTSTTAASSSPAAGPCCATSTSACGKTPTCPSRSPRIP